MQCEVLALAVLFVFFCAFEAIDLFYLTDRFFVLICMFIFIVCINIYSTLAISYITNYNRASIASVLCKRTEL